MPIYIDGDACPVKNETYQVARRHAVKVFVVANASIHVPREDLIELIVVPGGFDAADDWIVERGSGRRRDHLRHPARRTHLDQGCEGSRTQRPCLQRRLDR